MTPKDEPNLDAAIGQNLARERLLKGKTQKDLGNALGVSYTTVQKYETANCRISASKLLLACKFLDIPASVILEGEGSPLLSTDITTDPVLLRLIDAYSRISNPVTRRHLAEIATDLAELSS